MRGLNTFTENKILNKTQLIQILMHLCSKKKAIEVSIEDIHLPELVFNKYICIL